MEEDEFPTCSECGEPLDTDDEEPEWAKEYECTECDVTTIYI